jgi:hypothetical protein
MELRTCFITKNPVSFEAQRQPYRQCPCEPCQSHANELKEPVRDFNDTFSAVPLVMKWMKEIHEAGTPRH